MELFQEAIRFIREIYQQPVATIPLHAPLFRGNEKEYVTECIDSTYVSSVGKFVDLFETEAAKYTGVKKAAVTVNGTNALYLALLSVGVRPGDEVITQPLTFVATANAIVHAGAQPVFVDVDRETLGMSPEKLEDFLKKNAVWQSKSSQTINRITGKPITACVPMHTFGHPCRIEEICEICKDYHISVVEDAAESVGSFFKGRHAGTFGEIGILSFNGNKILTTGGGGMILTNDAKLGTHIKHLSTQAKINHPWEYDHDFIGYNFRMPNINAALGLAQLEQLEAFVMNKRETAAKYKEFFDQTDIDFFSEPENCRSNYWLNAIFLKNRKERDRFLQETNHAGVMTRPAWKPMNNLRMFKKAQFGDLSNSEHISSRLVNIPSSVVG